MVGRPAIQQNPLLGVDVIEHGGLSGTREAGEDRHGQVAGEVGVTS